MDFYTVKEIVFSYAEIREKEVEAYYRAERNTWWEQLYKHNAVADVAYEILGKDAGIFLNVLEGAPISEWPAKRLAAEGWKPSEYVPFRSNDSHS